MIKRFLAVLLGSIFGFFMMFGGVIISAMCCDYVLSLFNKNIPWYGDLILAIVTGGIAIPAAIIGWVLRTFGVI